MTKTIDIFSPGKPTGADVDESPKEVAKSHQTEGQFRIIINSFLSGIYVRLLYNFAVDVHKLKQEHIEYLKSFAKHLKFLHEKQHYQLKITLYGHASPSGTREKNIKLAEERALAVKKYLIQRKIKQEWFNPIDLSRVWCPLISKDWEDCIRSKPEERYKFRPIKPELRDQFRSVTIKIERVKVLKKRKIKPQRKKPKPQDICKIALSALRNRKAKRPSDFGGEKFYRCMLESLCKPGTGENGWYLNSWDIIMLQSQYWTKIRSMKRDILDDALNKDPAKSKLPKEQHASLDSHDPSWRKKVHDFKGTELQRDRYLQSLAQHLIGPEYIKYALTVGQDAKRELEKTILRSDCTDESILATLARIRREIDDGITEFNKRFGTFSPSGDLKWVESLYKKIKKSSEKKECPFFVENENENEKQKCSVMYNCRGLEFL